GQVRARRDRRGRAVPHVQAAVGAAEVSGRRFGSEGDLLHSRLLARTARQGAFRARARLGGAPRLARAPATSSLAMTEPRATIEQIQDLLERTIPLGRVLRFRIDALELGVARVTLPGSEEHTRAGGTISGPAIMALADTAIYAAVLTRIGVEPMALTSDLSVRFLRRP